MTLRLIVPPHINDYPLDHIRPLVPNAAQQFVRQFLGLYDVG